MMAGSAWATEYSASFKNADIEEFINTVGKNLNKTIIIEPSVRGKINVPATTCSTRSSTTSSS